LEKSAIHRSFINLAGSRLELVEKRFKGSLNIVNILHYYRKAVKKSRAFFSGVRLSSRWINFILLAVLIVAIALFAISRLTGKPVISRHIDITISPRFEDLFGIELANALLKDFEEQHPDLRITKAAEGADILFFDDSEFGRLRGGSKLLALNPYIAANKQDEATEQDVPVKDTQWALPLLSFMDLLFYNIDILQASNFDRPPKTRAEFLTVARTIARTREEQDEVYGFTLDFTQGARRNIYPWIWAAGGEIYASPRGDLSSNEPPVLSRTTVEIIAFFAQLYREDLLSPGWDGGLGSQPSLKGVESEVRGSPLVEFAQGKVAMITGSARDIAFLQSRNLNFGITAIPGTTQAKTRLELSKIYAGISADCALPDEAWAFLSFIAGKREILAEALTAIPGSIPADFPGEYILKDPLYLKAWDIFEAAEIVEYRSDDPSEEETERLVMNKIRESGMGSE
jgi:ABC-type glycerol-3-phosphate transport system substrate-binding protein